MPDPGTKDSWTYKDALLLAMKMLDKAKIKRTQWSFGGGTALMLSYKHRESKDIDIFIHDVQLLTLLTPRLNDFTDANSVEYKEASNFLKLATSKGEIDFIAAPFLTKNPFRGHVLGKEIFSIENPVEIIVKKIFYRREALTARDVYDIAFMVKNHPADLIEETEILTGCRKAILQRLEVLAQSGRFKEDLAALNIQDKSLAAEALTVVKNFFVSLSPSPLVKQMPSP